MSTSYEVTVKEAAHEDAGRGIARLSIEVMNALGLHSGDVIEIHGKGKAKALAIVWPGFIQDQGRRILRIDGNVRSIAKTGIDEVVTVVGAEVSNATKVVIQPTQPCPYQIPNQTFHQTMLGRPFIEGQTMRVNLMGSPFTFIISKVAPKGNIIVTRETEVSFNEKPFEAKDGEKDYSIADIHYEDIGGLSKELDQVREMVELPLRHPEIFERLGITPPKGVLLYGPPGTGKTLIARAVASEVEAHFITLSGPEIMSKFYGDSEEKLREIFAEAEENAPTIIFIDEIDSIAPKREDTKGEVERRIVAQLLSLMDGLKSRGQVIVIAATNLPDAIDPALRRGGRFDREIEIGIPDKKGRLEIFQVHTRGVPLDLEKIMVTSKESEELSRLFAELGEEEGHKKEEEIKRKTFLKPFAEDTHGFVGADIALLVKEAAMHALRKALKGIKVEDEIPVELIEGLKVTEEDFKEALKHVEPSAMREVLVEIPDVAWDDVGGLEEVKTSLIEAVEWPLKYPEVFDTLETRPPSGILLFGPPGTGKTLLAKAVANRSECNFISIKGPELLSKWVGESEKGVRDIFRKARQASPSIIFFDEIDALLPKRGSFEGSTHVTESVVSQILTELDGLEELTNVTIIGATNRPDMLDEAMLRPGRLDRIIYVPPPDAESRKKIFEVYLRNSELLASDINIDELVEKTDGYVGADIEMVVRESKLAAMREFIGAMDAKTEIERADALKNVRVTKVHFTTALEKVRGTLDKSTIEEYERTQAWKILYGQEERSVLEKAAGAVQRASFGPKTDKRESAIEELNKLLYAGRKNFKAIREHTEKLEKEVEEESQMHM